MRRWVRRTAAGSLVLVALLAVLTGFDLIASSPIGGGGSSGTRCNDLVNVLCYGNGTSGACTNSTIGSSACTVPGGTGLIMIGTVATSSTTIVSTGAGVAVKVGSTGTFMVVVSLQFSSTGSNILCFFTIHSSTVGIPALGAAIGAGDGTIGSAQATSTTASGNFLVVSMTGLLTGATGTVYFYIGFYTNSGTLTIQSGRGVVFEK